MVTWFMVQPLIRLLLLHWHILFVNDSTPAFLCHELQPKCIQNARRPKADTDIQRLPMGYKQSPPDPRNNLFPRYRPGIPMSQETGGPHLPPLAACSISFSKFLGIITDFSVVRAYSLPKIAYRVHLQGRLLRYIGIEKTPRRSFKWKASPKKKETNTKIPSLVTTTTRPE